MSQTGMLKRVDINVKNYSTDYIARIDLDQVVVDKKSSTGGNIEDIFIGFGSIYSILDINVIEIKPGKTSIISAVIMLNRAQVDTEIYTFTVTLNATAIVFEG